MGLPAIDHRSQRTRTRQPALRVVKQNKRSPKKSSRNASSTSVRRDTVRTVQSARSAFQLFTAVAVLVTALGVGRVWLSVQAAEASMQANQLRTDIKSERYEGDMLEVRQSALGSPSRIRAIAGQALDMAPAKKVTYLDIKDAPAARAGSLAQAPSDQAVQATKPVSRGVMGFVADMMRLSAGEAQVLLVGDVGLTSAK